jgi:putative membrane protein insertion efficiency factor
MKFLLLPLIKLYQWIVSPLLGSNCRHIPTCSEYTFDAIKYHGAVKGVTLGAKRISKCHPWSEASYDPVPKKKFTQLTIKNL